MAICQGRLPQTWRKRVRRPPDAKKPTFWVGFTLTPLSRSEFDGRISSDGFATAKNLVIGY
jgi:hypothetical protein